MIDLPMKFFAILPDGLMEVVIATKFVGPQIEILKDFATRVNGFLFEDFDGEGRALSVSATSVALAQEIEEIKLTTFWRPATDASGKVAQVPVWGAGGTEMKHVWTAPEDMGLFFIANWDVHKGHKLTDNEGLYYLIARDEKTRRTHLLPLPNLYDDGHLCLGDDGITLLGKPPMVCFEGALKILQATTWNSDLLQGRTITSQEMFRFDPNGEQLPPLRDWRNLSTLINHTHYQFIAKLP